MSELTIKAIRAAVDLPLQGQCEPPEDDAWHRRMKDAGIDSLGMHLEVVTPHLRAEIMPGKAQVPLQKYFDSFAVAVGVFGRGQVSTYILAGLGGTTARVSATECMTVRGRRLENNAYPDVGERKLL